eukprot:766102-Hanusia_phi.AAC.1
MGLSGAVSDSAKFVRIVLATVAEIQTDAARPNSPTVIKRASRTYEAKGQGGRASAGSAMPPQPRGAVRRVEASRRPLGILDAAMQATADVLGLDGARAYHRNNGDGSSSYTRRSQRRLVFLPNAAAQAP